MTPYNLVNTIILCILAYMYTIWNFLFNAIIFNKSPMVNYKMQQLLI